MRTIINKYIVKDTEIMFGQVTIAGTRITTECIYSMYSAGDSIQLLMSLYDLSYDQVVAVIEYESKEPFNHKEHFNDIANGRD